MRRFAKLPEWESGTASPTLKQLERYASVTHTPVGFFLLPEPPDVAVPLPDFRTRSLREVRQPSPDLLDTIYLCQQRQDWFRTYVLSTGGGPVAAVGSARADDDVPGTAARMRETLAYEVEQRPRGDRDGAFRRLSEAAEDLGILVMVSGITGSDTHRTLDPEEFQGFALSDDYAPVVFVNGADTRAAQIFTLAHELVHIWSGQSALDEVSPAGPDGGTVERWCNAVAAEFLVPARELTRALTKRPPAEELNRLAQVFGVSTLVILRRLRDTGHVPGDRFRELYATELRRARQHAASRDSGSGGNFYNTTPVRTSRRFARAVITSTFEGQTLYKDALRMLGTRRVSTFNDLASHLGVSLCPICWTRTSSSRPRTATTLSTSARPSGTGSTHQTRQAPSSASRKSAPSLPPDTTS